MAGVTHTQHKPRKRVTVPLDMSEQSEQSENESRRLSFIADVSLAHMSLTGMLDEMLTRLRDTVGVDTVAVLLLDEETNEVVARAAKGMEEEVDAGVRIPVGSGFAGRVAATRQPVILTDVEH